MAQFADAGAEIAACPQIAACQKNIRAKAAQIDAYRREILQYQDQIDKANGNIAAKNVELAQQLVLYASVVQGMIENGAIAAEVVAGSLAAPYPLAITKIRAEIATTETQIIVYQQNISLAEAKITDAQSVMTTITGQYTAFVAAIMAKW